MYMHVPPFGFADDILMYKLLKSSVEIEPDISNTNAPTGVIRRRRSRILVDGDKHHEPVLGRPR
jgi:hypothetical protein